MCTVAELIEFLRTQEQDATVRVLIESEFGETRFAPVSTKDTEVWAKFHGETVLDLWGEGK